MRQPDRKRQVPNKMMRNPDFERLRALKDKVIYIGSPEHKDAPSKLIKAKAPRPRPDASICPRSITDITIVNNWLKEAFEKGTVSEYFEGEFPRYVWFKQENIVYMGRLVNRFSGEYKGFPLNKFEWPTNIEKMYGK